jgi:PRC-barrel domain
LLSRQTRKTRRVDVAAEIPANKTLRFLPAEKARFGLCHFEKFAVKNDSAERIGELEGFIIDPPARKLRYVVVHPRGMFSRPRLVPLPGARIDAQSEALLVDESLSRCEPFDSARYPEISDDDVITALFAA